MDELFLIDANSLITPFLSYYPFDFAPSFWSQISDHISNGSIVILDMVKAEILKGNDKLREWIKNQSIATLVNHSNSSIIAAYGQVINYINENPCYSSAAVQEWSRVDVADPWLIAAAMTYKYTIVTFEVPSGGLNPKQPSKNPKIPDVSAHFQVPVQKLYYMMRKLGITLG